MINNSVTDPTVLRHITKLGRYPDEFAFVQDYAPKGPQTAPNCKRYACLSHPGINIMVASGLPMVDCNGRRLDVGLVPDIGGYRTRINVFDALVTRDGRVTLGCRNDQPDKRKNHQVACVDPVLYLNNVPVTHGQVRLLEVDPDNENYIRNVLEVDYGICKRRMRFIEGRFIGSWIFPDNPAGDIRIVYQQSGDFLVKLGKFKRNDNEEFIPRDIFNISRYPLTIRDTAIFYPDAGPGEANSIDGMIEKFNNNDTWANIQGAAAGSFTYDSSTQTMDTMMCGANSNTYADLQRSLFLFYVTIGVATITAATLSIYGNGKLDENNWTPTINIFSSNPAADNALSVDDYSTLGTTVFCDTPVAYADWTSVGYNDFVLNAAGRAAIPSTNNCAKYGVRTSLDVAEAPSWAANEQCYHAAWFAEKGTGYKPKLVITYAPPPISHIPLGFWRF